MYFFLLLGPVVVSLHLSEVFNYVIECLRRVELML